MDIEVIQLINKNIYYIYIWRIKETGEIFYIGKGSGNRYRSMKDRNEYLKNIRKKHECEVEIIHKNLEEEVAYDLELKLGLELKEKGLARACYVLGKTDKFISNEMKRKISKSVKGNPNNYWKGKKFSEEHKEKLRLAKLGTKQPLSQKLKRSETLKGHKVSEKTREKLSISKLGEKNPMYGKKQSIETINKRRKKLIGHEVGEETREKIGLSNSKKVKQIDKSTLEVIKIFNSASEAERKLNISQGKISRVCLGRRKSTGGFFWEYVQQDNTEVN